MVFKGHQMCTVSKDLNWVLDLTTYYGYRVIKDDTGNIISYIKAYKIYDVKDPESASYLQTVFGDQVRNERFIMERYVEVPENVKENSFSVIEHFLKNLGKLE